MRWQSSNEPSNRERVDVRPVDRRHLPALHVGDAALRVENEDFDLGLPGERLDRRGAGVARGRSNDRRPLSALMQDPIHRPAQPLHGEILERQRRPVEQLEREQVVLDLRDRRSRRPAEVSIRGARQPPDLGLVEVLADEWRHDPRRRFGVRNAPQVPDGLGRQMGNGERRIEAAVTGESREERVRKAQRRRRPAGRNIVHDEGILGRSGRRLAQIGSKGNGGGLGRRMGPKQDAPDRGFARARMPSRSRFGLEKGSSLSVT